MDNPAPPPVAAATPPTTTTTDPPTEPSSSTSDQVGASTAPELRPFSAFTAGSANQNTTATLVDNEDDDDDDAQSIVTVSTADSNDDHHGRTSQFALPPLGAASKEKPMEWDPFESSGPPPPSTSAPQQPVVATMAMPEPQVPTGPRAPDVQVVQMPTPAVQPPYTPSGVQVQPPGVSVLPPSHPGMTTAPPAYTGVFSQGYTPTTFGQTQPTLEKSMTAPDISAKSKASDLEKNSGNSMRERTFCYLGACSAFSIYWCCMLMLFVIPLGGILIFFWWSSRIQVSIAGTSAVASSASAPDANSLLFNMTVKVKIINKNSSPVQIRDVVTDAWFGGSGGFLQKKSIGTGRVANNVTIPGHAEQVVDVPVQMRFEASTDPSFYALEQVVRGCGMVSGGKRDIDMQLKVGVGATIGSRQLRTGVADTAHVPCPLAEDFKSDLVTKVVDDLKKKDGTA